MIWIEKKIIGGDWNVLKLFENGDFSSIWMYEISKNQWKNIESKDGI